MASEWPEIQLSELTEQDTPITYGVVKPGPEDTGGVLFIRSGDIAGGRVLTEQLRTITPDVSRQYQRTVLRGGEIVVSLVGNPGQVAIVPEILRGANIARQVGLIRLRSDVDTRFVKYFLSSRAGQEALGAHSLGSVQQVINLRDLKTVPVPMPPLLEQRAIAQILGTLDDKIELNRRVCETLDAMARALFQSWFVDFDPARTKVEGRDTGLPQPVAYLFPDSFENSKLGMIPKGWEVGQLGDVLTQRVERCSASAETAALPYVPIDCISSKSLSLEETKSGMEAQSSLTRFYEADLLFGAMRPYFHKVCIAPFGGTTRTTVLVLVPRESQDFTFATLLLHHSDTIDYATRHSTGSTIPYAVWKGSMEEMPIVIPSSKLRYSLDETVRPLLLRISRSFLERCALIALRGSLLPKLVSGQLRVAEALHQPSRSGSSAHSGRGVNG